MKEQEQHLQAQKWYTEYVEQPQPAFFEQQQQQLAYLGHLQQTDNHMPQHEAHLPSAASPSLYAGPTTTAAAGAGSSFGAVDPQALVARLLENGNRDAAQVVANLAGLRLPPAAVRRQELPPINSGDGLDYYRQQQQQQQFGGNVAMQRVHDMFSRSEAMEQHHPPLPQQYWNVA